MKSAMILYMLVMFGAWAIGLHASLTILSMAPRGQRLDTLWDLSFWRFATVETRHGNKVSPYLKRARLAGKFFVIGVLAPMILMALIGVAALILEESNVTGAN